MEFEEEEIEGVVGGILTPFIVFRGEGLYIYCRYETGPSLVSKQFTVGHGKEKFLLIDPVLVKGSYRSHFSTQVPLNSTSIRSIAIAGCRQTKWSLRGTSDKPLPTPLVVLCYVIFISFYFILFRFVLFEKGDFVLSNHFLILLWGRSNVICNVIWLPIH